MIKGKYRIYYLVVCLFSMVLIFFSIKTQNDTTQELLTILKNNAQKLIIPQPDKKAKEVTSELLKREKNFFESPNTHRKDPFALLAIEKRNPLDSKKMKVIQKILANQPVNPPKAPFLPTKQGQSFYRGMFYGAKPKALIEENGRYYQAEIGDSFRNGIIHEINKNHLLIKLENDELRRINLGE